MEPEAKVRIGGIVDMSTVDWYGNVSLIIFFAGCNFRCPYCQNSSLIPVDAGSEVDMDYLRGRILENMTPVPQLDAVVFTGGEPTLQPKGLEAAAKLVKEMNFKVMLDSNGSNPKIIESLFKQDLVDRVALDVKGPLNSSGYMIAAGLADPENIVANVEETIELCNRYNVEVEARTTVAPGVSDSDEFIREIAEDIKGRCTVYYLQQYDNTGDILSPDLKLKMSPTRERMIELANIAVNAGLENVHIKTRNMGLERID